MKKLALLLIMAGYSLRAVGQTPPDTLRVAAQATAIPARSLSSLNQNVSTLSTKLDTTNQRINKALLSAGCKFCQPELKGMQGWLVSTPLLLFILASFYVLVQLRREGYKISDSLKENYAVDVSHTTEPISAQIEVEKELKMQGVDKASFLPNVELPSQVRPQSTSRLIAFFAGMASVITAISSLTFFFYVYLRTGEEPKFENLYNVVLGLGIGVIPYTFNRLSDALNPPQNNRT